MDLSDTVHIFIKLTETFVEIFEKNFNSKYEFFLAYSKPLLGFISSSYFELKVFSSVSRKLSVDLMKIFKISERSS